MVRRKSPLYAAPSQSLIDTLPPELLHHVFAYLPQEDVLAARATCTLFAAIGADHILSEFGLYYKRDRFRQMAELAQHEVLSKRVKSLYFQGDRFPQDFINFNTWNEERVPLSERKGPRVDETPGLEWSDSERYQRAFIRAIRRDNAEYEIRKQSYTDDELQRAFACYEELIEDQKAVRQEEYDTQCLATFFKGCQNLANVTLSFHQSSSKTRGTGRRTFRNAMTSPHGDVTWEDQGVYQLSAIAEAVHRSGIELKSLTLTDMSPRVFETQPTRGERLMQAVRPLKKLRIFIQPWAPEGDEVSEQNALDELEEFLEGGACKQWLSSAAELRVLKVQGPTAFQTREADFYACLKDVIADGTWQHLVELGLSKFVTTEQEFFSLLSRHKKTLRRLTLSDIFLEVGSWESTFQRLGGMLPHLRKIKLRGNFYSSTAGDEFDFDIPGGESRKISPHRDSIENYFVKGGQWPDHESLETQTVYPWDDPEYVPPGLPEEPFPDAALYEWDDMDFHL